jgi:hypothetical protein
MTALDSRTMCQPSDGIEDGREVGLAAAVAREHEQSGEARTR